MRGRSPASTGTTLPSSAPLPRVRGGRTRWGGNALEFALLLPVFCGLVEFGLEYGLVFHLRSEVSAAAWSGCRAGATTDPEAADPEEVARQAIQEGLEAGILPGVDCPGDPDSCRVEVQVSGESPARSIACEASVDNPGLGGGIVAPERIRASAVILLEYQE